jgi:hypothetical protein
MMPIRTVWLVKDHVILTQPVGDIMEADYVGFMKDLERLIAPFGPEVMVHVLQDARKIGKPFSRIATVVSFLGMLRRFKGWYLVLNRPSNRFFEFLAQFSAHIIGIRTRPPYSSYAEARAFLIEQYPDLALPETLPDLFEHPGVAEAH